VGARHRPIADPGIDGRAELRRALRKRGRSWGSINPEQLARMKAELEYLQDRPKVRLAKFAEAFGNRTMIPGQPGGFRRNFAKKSDAR
jgi:hypothetical protein